MSNLPKETSAVSGGYTSLDGERYFRIANSHLMEDFFMSLVGAGDHWMFVSSNGALTAGRRNTDNALFPYASDDKISTGRAETGSFSLVRLETPLKRSAQLKQQRSRIQVTLSMMSGSCRI